MDFKREYDSKLMTMDEVAMEFKSEDIIATPCALGQSTGIIKAICERAVRDDLHDLTVHMLLTLEDMPYLNEPYSNHISHVAWFTSAYARKPIAAGRANYLPVFYKDAPRFWREKVKADVFVGSVSPMDEKGYFTFGASTSVVRAQMESADKIFLEVNENVPRVYGSETVHISQVDGVVENNVPLPETGPVSISEEDAAIGRLIANEIKDGSTIQLGIGAMPNALAGELKDRRHLGIHSEMFTGAMVDLIENGIVDNSRKTIDTGFSVASFSFGTKKTYDFLHENTGVYFRSIEYVNDPRVIGQLDNFVSINSCIEVDLFGQVCSESVGTKIVSGVGGQTDFVRGAWLSKGGQSFISVQSKALKGTVSAIKPVLTEGAHISCSAYDVDNIVTEHGIARLKGLTLSERAKELIKVAAPEFREELTFAAKKMNIMI